MLRIFIAVVAGALSLSSIALASAAPAQPPAPPQKHHASRHWHGYGFLPGYRTPEQIERAARGTQLPAELAELQLLRPSLAHVL